MFPEGIAIGAVGKGDVHHLRIGHGLLQAIPQGVPVILCLYNGDGMIGVDIQDVIRLFRSGARHQISPQIDAAISYLRFHGHQPFPLGGKGWRDVMEFDILFGHLPLGNDAAHFGILHAFRKSA